MKEYRVNYVIGTCGNRNLRSINDTELPLYSDYLKLHLASLVQTDLSPIDQITIMKPDIDNIDPNYYIFSKDKSPCPIVMQECKNEYLSYGQWIKAYQLHNDFDYYIFIEDDYMVSNRDFKKILVQEFESSKRTKRHYLCTLIRKWDCIPIVAAISNGITDQESLSLINSNLDFVSKMKDHPQVDFSSLFDSISDYAEKYRASFWASSRKQNILFHRNIFPKDSLFDPLQWNLYKDYVVLEEEPLENI